MWKVPVPARPHIRENPLHLSSRNEAFASSAEWAGRVIKQQKYHILSGSYIFSTAINNRQEISS